VEEVVGSFPYEEWANEVQDALSGKGVMAEVVYAGPRAYPVYIDSRDSKKAQEVLADIGYMNCSTGGGHLGLGNVLGWFPFDGTEEDYEELEGDVSQAMDKMVEKLANASAAQAWSNNEDRDMFVVADFDGQIGVNGDLIINRPVPPVPEGFRRTNEGGRIPVVEEEVSVEFVVRGVLQDPEFAKYEKALLEQVVNKVAAQKYLRKGVTYTTVSGESEIYRKVEDA